MIDYSDIVEVDTDSAKARIRTWLARLPIPVTLWAEGGMGEACVEIGAGIWNEVSKICVALKAFAVGEASSGLALEIYSWNVYKHTRNPGEYAVHRVVLSCAEGAGPYTLTKGSMIVGSADSSFWLDSVIGGSFPFVLASGSSQAFAVKCGTVGAAANVGIGLINRLLTTYVGVTCTNPENVAGSNSSLITAGANTETDASLRTRNSLKWATRNPLSLVEDSYKYYAMQAAPNVKRVKVLGTGAYGICTVNVIIAAENATSGSEDVDKVQADLIGRVLSAQVEVQTHAGEAVQIEPEGTVYYLSTFALASVQTAVSEALTAALAANDIGGRSVPGMGTYVIPTSDVSGAIEHAMIGDQRCVSALVLTSPSGSFIPMGDVKVAVLGSLSGLTWVAVAA